MAHFPKPFFRLARSLWYVQLDGKQINLGPDESAAFKAYHALMHERAQSAGRPVLPAPNGAPFVVVLVDDFLDWCQKHRAPHTYRWYRDRLNEFCKSIERSLAADALRPHHVQKWVDSQPKLASGSIRNLIASVKRCMKWAEEQGYIERSPIAHMRKPACGRKEQVVTPTEFQALLGRFADQEFRDLLVITWETGCRPQESLRVEARHVDVAGNRWVFPASESKGKRSPRVVYLTPTGAEITKRLMEKHPTGPLFRNTDGAGWTPCATNCRFQHVRKKTGVKYSLYSLRHSFATRALMNGVDCITVSTLMGHSDPSTLARVYQHLGQNSAYLGEQLKKVMA